MANNYVFPGRIVDYHNSSESHIWSGDGVVLGDLFGVAEVDIPPGEVGSVRLEGVFDLPKGSGDFAQGDTLYWTGSEITADPENNHLAGYAAAAAGLNDAMVQVKIRAERM